MKKILGFLAMALLAAVAVAPGAAAADYPSRTVKMIVPFGAGGGTDILGRIIAVPLPKLLGQDVFIENKGGGGSAVGTVAAIRSPADGYTLLFQSSAFTINTALRDNLPYDAINDLAPISLLATGPVVMVAHPSLGAKTLDEVLALASKNPGSITFATGGQGSSPHLGQEQLMAATGTKFVTVHYKGSGPAIKDLLGGHVKLMLAGVSQSRKHIESGAIVPIAVTGAKRNAAIPNVPTFGELGLGDKVTAGTIWGVLAPAGTPKPIIDKLGGIFAEIMRMDSIVEKLESLGYVAVGSTPEEYADNIKSEIARWTKVVNDAGIKKK